MRRCVYSLLSVVLLPLTHGFAEDIQSCLPQSLCDPSIFDGCLGEDSCCGTGELNCCLTPLTNLLHPSDHCFDDFISPMTNPVFFEDPRTLTEARFIFMHHDVPAVVGGGDIQLYGMQVRAALTEDLSLIASKDGYIISDNPLMNDGWADVSVGLKYNVFKDPQAQQILSAGFMFELPIGSTRSLQGTGDGEFNLFASAGTEFLETFHYLTSSGFRLPTNRAEESTVWYWSNHVDWQIEDTGFYLFGETNWYHWMRSGRSFPLPVEGIDLINLGSIGVAGNDIVTGAVGVKYKPTGNLELGIAWEAPMTRRRDVMDDRFTFDCILRF